MSNRHRALAGFAGRTRAEPAEARPSTGSGRMSADTAIGEVEDLTPCVKPALFELGDRPGLPTRWPAVGMIAGQAGIVVENATHPVGVVGGIGRYAPCRARLH